MGTLRRARALGVVTLASVVAACGGGSDGGGSAAGDGPAAEISAVGGFAAETTEAPSATEATASEDTDATQTTEATDAANTASTDAATPAGADPGSERSDPASRVPPAGCDGGRPSAYTPKAPADVAAIQTNEIVTGEIERFTVDNWTVHLCAGQSVFMDSLLQCSGDPYLDWRLIVPDGDKAFPLNYLIGGGSRCGGATGPIEIAETGDYTVEVFYDGTDDRSGAYKFEILNVPLPDVFDVAIGDEIGLGTPGPGAGALEYPGSRDHYRLNLEAGDRIFLDNADRCDGEAYMDWQLIVPDGDKAIPLDYVIAGGGRCGGDSGPIDIPEAGTYILEVFYAKDSAAVSREYGFEIVDASGGR